MQEAVIFSTDEGESRIHFLKTWTEFYNSIVDEDITKRKCFEVRKNDRNYRVGDYLLLQDYDNNTEKYIGRETWRKITYILRDNRFLPEDMVVMSLIEKAPTITILR